jgi:hypothetical protein
MDQNLNDTTSLVQQGQSNLLAIETPRQAFWYQDIPIVQRHAFWYL